MPKSAYPFDDDFLLDSRAARRLYHEHAATQPIIDYHNHLPPADIAGDRVFPNLQRIWLEGDHYKWRAMRSDGVPERLITGDGDDRAKFQAWAETVPRTLGNPLWHWTHLELRRPFAIQRMLDGASAQRIWERGEELLAKKPFSVRGILKQMDVRVVCTTDDPADDLIHHRALAADPAATVRMLPTWRPDRVMAIDDPAAFNAWVDRLGAAADVGIAGFTDLKTALEYRHQAFHDLGCRLSDHGLDTVWAEDFTEDDLARSFSRLRSGQQIDADAAARWRSGWLHLGAVMDHARGWAQQFHIGTQRNNNTRMRLALGADSGFDSIGEADYAKPLARFLDRLDRDDRLARTILYNSNPRDNAMLASMCGNFQDGSTPAKIQFGAAWWFLDQKDGIERHLDALESLCLMSRWVGMLTDSRSFLSFTRHEYFRRILCARLGRRIEAGELPRDIALVGRLVEDVSYGNAERWFGFQATTPKAKKRRAS